MLRAEDSQIGFPRHCIWRRTRCCHRMGCRIHRAWHDRAGEDSAYLPCEFRAAGLIVPDSSMARRCNVEYAWELRCDTASITSRDLA